MEIQLRKLFQPRRYRIPFSRGKKNITLLVARRARDRLFLFRREAIRCRREGGGGTTRVMRIRLGRLKVGASCLLFSNLLLLIERTSAFHYRTLYEAFRESCIYMYREREHRSVAFSSRVPSSLTPSFSTMGTRKVRICTHLHPATLFRLFTWLVRRPERSRCYFYAVTKDIVL